MTRLLILIHFLLPLTWASILSNSNESPVSIKELVITDSETTHPGMVTSESKLVAEELPSPEAWVSPIDLLSKLVGVTPAPYYPYRRNFINTPNRRSYIEDIYQMQGSRSPIYRNSQRNYQQRLINNDAGFRYDDVGFKNYNRQFDNDEGGFQKDDERVRNDDPRFKKRNQYHSNFRNDASFRPIRQRNPNIHAPYINTNRRAPPNNLPKLNIPQISTLINPMLNMINPMNYFTTPIPRYNPHFTYFSNYRSIDSPMDSHFKDSPIRSNQYLEKERHRTINNLPRYRYESYDLDSLNDEEYNYDFEESDKTVSPKYNDRKPKRPHTTSVPFYRHKPEYGQKEDNSHRRIENTFKYIDENNHTIVSGDPSEFLEKYKEDFPLRDDLYIGNDGGLYLKPEVVDGRQFLSDEEKAMIEDSDFLGADRYGMDIPRSGNSRSRNTALRYRPSKNIKQRGHGGLNRYSRPSQGWRGGRSLYPNSKDDSENQDIRKIDIAKTEKDIIEFITDGKGSRGDSFRKSLKDVENLITDIPFNGIFMKKKIH